MQTDDTVNERGHMELRKDGSVSMKDLSIYLISRHGIQITPEKLTELLLTDVHVHSHEDRLDLIQIVAILFIPHLCKLAMHANGIENNDTFVDEDLPTVNKVLQMIFHDATHSTHDESCNCSHGVPLTKEIVRNILLSYGEAGMADDEELVDEMVQAAKLSRISNDKEQYDHDHDHKHEHDHEHEHEHEHEGRDREEHGSIMLDKDSFLHALTADVAQHYDVVSESKLSTKLDDAFQNCQCKSNNNTNLVFSEKNQDNGGKNMRNTDGMNEKSNSNTNIEKTHNDEPFRFVSTLQGIDYIAGTYLCKYTVMAVWVAFYFLFLGYLYPMILLEWRGDFDHICDNEYEPLLTFEGNIDEFRCDISLSIINWYVLYLAMASIGTSFVLAGSMGYESDSRDQKLPLILSTLVMTAITAILPVKILENCSKTNTRLVCYSQIIALIAMSKTVYLRWVRVINLLDGGICFTWRSPSLRKESILKQAAGKKIWRLHEHALSMHQGLDKSKILNTYFGQGLSNYNKTEDRTERVGNLSWGLNQIVAEVKDNDDGIWLSARIQATIICQWSASIMILLAGMTITEYLFNNWESSDNVGILVSQALSNVISEFTNSDIVQNATDLAISRAMDVTSTLLELIDDAGLLQFDCLTISSLLVERCSFGITSGLTDLSCSIFASNSDDLCVTLEPLFRPLEYSFDERSAAGRGIFNSTAFNDRLYEVIYDATYDNIFIFLGNWYPEERYMAWIPSLIGFTIALIASLTMTIFVIPNTKTTILKLRSGVIPTFHDPETFTDRRSETVETAKVSGVMFWGNIFGSLTIGGIIGGFLFLTFWQVTAFFMQYLIAIGTGIVVVVLFRWAVISRSVRVYCWKSLYRTRPALANLATVSDECVNLAIFLLFVPARLLTSFLLSALYAGRVDVSFMSPGIDVPIEEIFSYRVAQLDPYHNIYLSSLLISEAHRHPYIETIGLMLLLKLRHKTEFMNRACSCWRLVFVTALMPWLRKYRILTYEHEGEMLRAEKIIKADMSSKRSFDKKKDKVFSENLI